MTLALDPALRTIESRVPAGDAPPPRLSGFGMVRVAALPFDALTTLSPRSTAAHLELVIEHFARMEQLRPRIEDALYVALPLLQRQHRGPLLDIRRAVHNGKPCTPAADVLEALKGVSPEAHEVLGAWLEAASTASALLLAAEECLETELSEWTRPRLLAVAADRDFRRALAHASPDLLEAVGRAQTTSRGVASTKLERSLLSYLTRAAAKTSPFGLFMHQAVVTLDPRSGGGTITIDPADRTSHSYLNPGLAVLFRQRSAMHYSLNGSLWWTDENIANCIVTQFVGVGGRLWRSEKPLVMRLHAVVAEVLRGLPAHFSLHELVERFVERGLAHEMGVQLASRLADKHLLLPVADGAGVDAATPQVIQELAEKAASFSTASAEARLALSREVERGFRTIAASAAGIPDLHLIMEDGHFSRAYGPIGRDATQLLDTVRSVLSDAIVIRPQYAALQQLFVTRFGKNGVCTDVPAFLNEAAESLRTREVALRRGERLRSQSERTIRAAATVLLQIAAEGEQRLAVVNQVHAGAGWLTARHAAGEHAGARALSRHLREWLRLIKQPKEPIDFAVCADCNPLQLHPQLTDRTLVWPGEPPPESGALHVADTLLVADATSGLLELFDRAGNRLAPVYLGSTIPTHAWGARYWLTVIAEPFAVDIHHERWSPPPAGIDFEHRLRQTKDRVVLDRECWWVRSERVSRIWFAHSGVQRQAAVLADCRRTGVPRTFFARGVLSPNQPVRGDFHKPLWIDIRNPFCLDLLANTADHCEWLVFSEVLPAPENVSSAFDGLNHVTELLVEMLL